MSGGAFNYGYYKIEQLQEDILREFIERDDEVVPEIDTVLLGRLLKLLGKTAQITKAVEWHFSQDAEITTLAEADKLFNNENERLRIALADAIRRPMGVVPDSAIEFLKENKE